LYKKTVRLSWNRTEHIFAKDALKRYIARFLLSFKKFLLPEKKKKPVTDVLRIILPDFIYRSLNWFTTLLPLNVTEKKTGIFVCISITLIMNTSDTT